jgi:hypothetical protein
MKQEKQMNTGNDRLKEDPKEIHFEYLSKYWPGAS